MSEHVRITDVSPRDGLQNERGVVPTEDKAELIRLLCASGVDEVEATSFVSPKWVPQLGDAKELLEKVRRFEEAGAAPSPSPGGRGARGEGYQGSSARNANAVRSARSLRREMTGPERRLWSKLRGDQMHGLRFRRQHPIDRYVVDFFCPALRLAIEVDGMSHDGETAQKRDAAREEAIRRLGVRVIRFTNDQVLGDLDAVLRAIGQEVTRLQRESRSGSPLPNPLPPGEGSRVGRSSGHLKPPVISVLVPNEKGFERALEVHSDAFPLKVAVFTAASETFSRKNTNASVEETIERFRAFVPRALEMGMDVRMYVSCAIACPYEGPMDPARVRDVVDRLSTLAPEEAFEDRVAEIDLGDTIGAGTAASTRALLEAFEPERRAGFVLHLHDTRGTAAECIGAGLEMGVRHFDGSVAGLGGCPYAGTPEKPAPGNVSTETVVRTVEAAGFSTFVDLERLGEAAACARRIVGAARAAG